MLEQLKKLVKDEEAPTAVEYALMVACSFLSYPTIPDQ
jgi:Flp pilus assembly pilin Flp